MRILDQLVIVIPAELSEKLGLKEGEEVNIYELKPGLIAITTKKGKRIVSEEKIKYTEEEINLLKKLLSFKFEQRIPEIVNKQLSTNERKILSDLIRRRIVTIYKKDRYKEKGVYNIPERVYKMILEIGTLEKEKTEASEEGGKTEEKGGEIKPLDYLERFGFIVAENERDAKKLSDELASNVRKKEVMGVRGFDKKYYIVKSNFVSKYRSKIKNAIKEGNKTVDQIAAATGLENSACVALLTILNEEGEIIEKRKGTFINAD